MTSYLQLRLDGRSLQPSRLDVCNVAVPRREHLVAVVNAAPPAGEVGRAECQAHPEGRRQSIKRRQCHFLCRAMCPAHYPPCNEEDNEENIDHAPCEQVGSGQVIHAPNKAIEVLSNEEHCYIEDTVSSDKVNDVLQSKRGRRAGVVAEDKGAIGLHGVTAFHVRCHYEGGATAPDHIPIFTRRHCEISCIGLSTHTV